MARRKHVDGRDAGERKRQGAKVETERPTTPSERVSAEAEKSQRQRPQEFT